MTTNNGSKPTYRTYHLGNTSDNGRLPALLSQVIDDFRARYGSAPEELARAFRWRETLFDPEVGQ